jgi:hypothetical protein
MPAEAHPTPFELEAHHVGETSEAVAIHVRDCESCRGHLAALEDEARRFAARSEPDQFVRLIRRRAQPRRRVVGAGITGALLAAACLLVLVSRPGAPGPAAIDALVDKGGSAPAVAVLLMRDGQQTRSIGPVEGRAGDRFRIEIATRHPALLEAVIVDETGSVTPVLPPQRLGAGTHLLEPTFAFDQRTTTARLLVGAPAALRRALAGQTEAEVVALSLRSASSP